MFDYWKVGQTLQDDFLYRDKTTFAGVTGKVQGDFTIKLAKNGVGNQSTTGITITQVDATNNSGLYAVSISGTTGFSSAPGEYTLNIYDTASPGYSWESTYIVTSDGTGEGTLGSASFTAISGNGRITDGASALTGATVYIRDPSSVLYALLTTDASGLWGPVWFNRNGTWTVYAQKSGYSVGSATITVSGTTATGPLVDIALSAVSVGTGLTLGELMSYGRRMVRDAVGSKSDTDLKSAINDGLGMIAREKRWPWFERQSEFTLNPAYSTGTITVTNASATVTLSGGTFPTWVSSDAQIKANGQWHRIASRDSGTQVTLAVAWGEASTTFTASNWVVFQDEYSLPSDCIRFGRIFPGEKWPWSGDPTSYENVLASKNLALWQAQFPWTWAIHKNRFVMWPYANTNYNLPFMYWIKPAVLVNVSDEADWDPCQLELLQRAIDYQLAIRFGTTVSGDANVCYARYQGALAKAMPMDKTPARPANPFASISNPNQRGLARLLP